MCADRRQICAFVGSAQEELLKATTDALTNGAVKSDVVQMVRRLQECQETGSLLGNHADKFMAALKAYRPSLTNVNQKCLKQIKARSNNGDFETHTRWLRAVASLSEAERVIFVGTKVSALPFSLQTLRDEIGAAHHGREVFYACFVDWVRLLHEQYHDGLESRQVR